MEPMHNMLRISSRRGLPVLGMVAALLMTACTGGDSEGDAISERTTDLCDGIVGFEALAWEYYNGVPVVDSVLPPPFPDFGGSYSHTDFPLLGFTYPPGWTPFEIRDASTQGVDLIRDDREAIWRSVSVTVQGIPQQGAVKNAELDAARTFFEISAPYSIVCETQATIEQGTGTGIFTTFDNVLVRAGERTVLLTTSVTPLPGLPTSSVAVRLLSSATSEFPQRIYDTFMAIDWQMLAGGTNDRDRDRDGWLDEFDMYPDDPNRH